MKKIFVLTIALFLLIVFPVNAQEVDAEIRPDICPAGTVQKNIEDSNSSDVLCLPAGDYDGGKAPNDGKFYICEYEDWDYNPTAYNDTCCPEGFIGNNIGWCCPTDYSFFGSGGNRGCLDRNDVQWPVGVTTNIFGRMIDTSRGIVNGNNTAITVADMSARFPDVTVINSANEDIYWCPDINYYCQYRGRGALQFFDYFGPSFRWTYDSSPADALANRYTTSSQTPFNARPAIEWGANQGKPRCVSTCSEKNEFICLPQIGWIERTNTWQGGLNPSRDLQDFIDPDGGGTIPVDDPSLSNWQDVDRLLCEGGDIKDVLPPGIGRDDAVISGCGRIISYRSPNGAVLFRDQVSFPDLYVEYEKCQICQGTIENPTGNLWSEFGCIEPTASGIVNRIFQIAVGIAGGIIIFRILQSIVKLNLEEPTQEREAEIREIFTSIVVFLIVTLGSVVVLRFLVVNLLGFPLPSLFSF